MVDEIHLDIVSKSVLDNGIVGSIDIKSVLF